MDVLDHLTEEHRKVEVMISQLKSSEPGSERDRLVGELTAAMQKHMAVEEQHLYPMVASMLGSETETEAEIEHDLLDRGRPHVGGQHRRRPLRGPLLGPSARQAGGLRAARARDHARTDPPRLALRRSLARTIVVGGVCVFGERS